MEYRKLGSTGPLVSAEGLGCAGMSEIYGKPDSREAVATIHRALELGINLLDTAELYGSGANEELVGRAIVGRREDVVLATKFAGPLKDGKLVVNGRPGYVKSSCDASLRRLGTDYIDLFYQHRVDPAVPIEDTVGAMGELVRVGKVLHLGLCEASATTVRRAAAVHPIAALQSEWSVWTRDIESDLLQAARDAGLGVVAFSPLGRGFLGGKLTSPEDFDDGDLRRDLPRFQGEHFEANQKLVQRMETLARQKACTVGQLALAWLLSRGDDVVPIPGTKRRSYLEENVAALDIVLTPSEQGFLESLDRASGDRYGFEHSYGESPMNER